MYDIKMSLYAWRQDIGMNWRGLALFKMHLVVSCWGRNVKFGFSDGHDVLQDN